MEFVNNEIDTKDLANFLAIDDEYKGVVESSSDGVNGGYVNDLDDSYVGFTTDEDGNRKELSADEMAAELFAAQGLNEDGEDAIDQTDLIEEGGTLDPDYYYEIAGKQLAVDEIENAVKALEATTQFDEQREKFRSGMSELQNFIERSEFIRMGEFDASIAHWSEQMDNAKGRGEWELAKQNWQVAQSRKQAAEVEFEKYKQRIEAGRAEQEALEATQVVNELAYRHGWNQQDYQEVVEYLNENKINVKPQQLSAQLMIALKKAAAFDNGRKSKEIDLDKKVKSLVGRPVSSSDIDEVTKRDTRKQKAKIRAERGELSPSEMFAFLDD